MNKIGKKSYGTGTPMTFLEKNQVFEQNWENSYGAPYEFFRKNQDFDQNWEKSYGTPYEFF